MNLKAIINVTFRWCLCVLTRKNKENYSSINFYWFSGTNISIVKTFFHLNVFVLLLGCVFILFSAFGAFLFLWNLIVKKDKTALITSITLLLTYQGSQAYTEFLFKERKWNFHWWYSDGQLSQLPVSKTMVWWY